MNKVNDPYSLECSLILKMVCLISHEVFFLPKHLLYNNQVRSMMTYDIELAIVDSNDKLDFTEFVCP